MKPTRIHTASPDLNRVQDSVADAIRAVDAACVTGDGHSTVSVTLQTTDVSIPHGLGRAPVGYLVAKRDKAGHVFDGAAPSQTPHKTITLKSDVANLTVTIIFF